MRILPDSLPKRRSVTHAPEVAAHAVAMNAGFASEASAGRDPLLADIFRTAAREVARALREHTLLIVLVAMYCAAGRALPALFGIPTDHADHLYSSLFFTMAGAAGILFIIAYAIHLRLIVRPNDFVGVLKRDLFGRFLTLRRICTVLPVLVLVPFFGATFTNLKILIPAFQPFSWDPTFAEWDRWIHGGYHPWEWLQPLLGYPFVTSFINAVYHSWFFLAYGVLLWQATSVTRPRLRMQYLLTFLLIWALIGNAAAIMLSSAGPVYFGRVTGLPDPFTALMHYLNQASELAPVPALGVQEMLWSTYESKGVAFGGGISAMPSLHVAVAYSFFLLARAIDRRLAIAAGLFVALILIGSVHLGWHYALDGYLAIPMTWLIWRGVGWTLDRPIVRALQGAAEPAPVAADACACLTTARQ